MVARTKSGPAPPRTLDGLGAPEVPAGKFGVPPTRARSSSEASGRAGRGPAPCALRVRKNEMTGNGTGFRIGGCGLRTVSVAFIVAFPHSEERYATKYPPRVPNFGGEVGPLGAPGRRPSRRSPGREDDARPGGRGRLGGADDRLRPGAGGGAGGAVPHARKGAPGAGGAGRHRRDPAVAEPLRSVAAGERRPGPPGGVPGPGERIADSGARRFGDARRARPLRRPRRVLAGGGRGAPPGPPLAARRIPAGVPGAHQ